MKRTSEQNPNQLELIQQEPLKRRMVTVGLNAHTDTRWGGYYYYRDFGREKRENVGIAVIVDTRDLPTNLKTLKHVMGYYFVDVLRIPAQTLWFTQHKDYVIISGYPGTAAHPTDMAKLPGGIGCVTAHDKKVWSYKLLSSRCHFWERVTSDCKSCEHADFGQACIRAQFLPHEPKPPETMAEAKTFLDCCPDDMLLTVLKQATRSGPFEVVHPRHTADHPFMKSLREANGIDFGFVEQGRKRERDRARNGVITKKCLKRCREECFFFKECDRTTGRMYGAPQWCQGTKETGSFRRDTPRGPFLASEVEATQKGVLGALAPEHRKTIEFFVQNGGAETRIFGHKLRLGKMNPTLQFVEWYEPYGHRAMRFSVEDSMKLLHTPYRRPVRRGGYEYPEVHPGLRLTDKYLFLYIELCQGNSYRVKKANRHTHMRWYEFVRPVELELKSGYFLATDGRMNEVGMFGDYNAVFARKSSHTLPSLLLDYLNRTRPTPEPEETAEQETSWGKRPSRRCTLVPAPCRPFANFLPPDCMQSALRICPAGPELWRPNTC